MKMEMIAGGASFAPSRIIVSRVGGSGAQFVACLSTACISAPRTPGTAHSHVGLARIEKILAVIRS